MLHGLSDFGFDFGVVAALPDFEAWGAEEADQEDRAFVEFLRSHMRENISLDDLADCVGLSR